MNDRERVTLQVNNQLTGWSFFFFLNGGQRYYFPYSVADWFTRTHIQPTKQPRQAVPANQRRRRARHALVILGKKGVIACARDVTSCTTQSTSYSVSYAALLSSGQNMKCIRACSCLQGEHFAILCINKRIIMTVCTSQETAHLM